MVAGVPVQFFLASAPCLVPTGMSHSPLLACSGEELPPFRTSRTAFRLSASARKSVHQNAKNAVLGFGEYMQNSSRDQYNDCRAQRPLS